MQTLRLTNSELKKEFANCKDLKSVISEIEAKAWERGEVVCEIRVNDMFLTEEDEERFSKSTIDDIKKLEVCSQKKDDLISLSKQSIIEWIPEIKKSSLSIAELFRDGEKDKAQKHLPSIFEGFNFFAKALLLLKGNIIRVKKVKENEESFKKWETLEVNFMNIIKEILVAFENRDYILLSDALEYDLSTNLDEWIEFLKQDGSVGESFLK